MYYMWINMNSLKLLLHYISVFFFVTILIVTKYIFYYVTFM